MTTAAEYLAMFNTYLGESGAKVQAFQDASAGMFEDILDTTQLAIEGLDMGQELRAAYLEQADIILSSVNEIQALYGGVQNLQEANNEFSLQQLDILNDINLAHLGTSEGMLTVTDAFGNAGPAMQKFFESGAEAQRLYIETTKILSEEVPEITKQLTTVDSQKIALFRKNLKITEAETAALMRRTYAFTGEASTQILDEIGAYGQAVADEMGISPNLIHDKMLLILQDTDRFGDIGVDSVSRIAGALGKLGVSMESYTGMLDKFTSFDTAAENMGELSAMFGLQMDAMEMMYLANEDQEEFLYRIREQIIDQGLDVENMSKTRARALANQLNMSVEEMKTFLSEDITLDELELMDATAEADIDEGMNRIAELGQLAKEQVATVDDMIKRQMAKSLISHQEEIQATTNQLIVAAEEFERTLVVPEQFGDEFISKGVELSEEFRNVMSSAAAAYINPMLEAIGVELEYMEELHGKIVQDTEGFAGRFDIENIVKSVETGEEFQNVVEIEFGKNASISEVGPAVAALNEELTKKGIDEDAKHQILIQFIEGLNAAVVASQDKDINNNITLQLDIDGRQLKTHLLATDSEGQTIIVK